ncbi:MAG TPA: DUF6644 family protein [Vicinamibacterales bacterium]|nr:DUF6644 family protein [Vicinamibacterales bacterium]
MTLLQICEWLESTRLAELVTQSLYGFQIVVAVHLMGLGLSVGTVIWFDLRLLGKVLQTTPVSEVYRRLAPWMLAGFTMMFASGAVIFVGFATAAYANPYFRVKLAVIALAGVNAVLFHFFTQRRLAGWDAWAYPPAAARVAGAVSIASWIVVVLAGRMMSYTMF